MLLSTLPQSLEVINVRGQGLGESVFVIVPDTELVACILDYRSDLRVVDLANAWEQVMCGLMVQST